MEPIRNLIIQVEAKDKEISQLQQVISSLRDEMTTVYENRLRESPEKQCKDTPHEPDPVLSAKRNESYEKENEKLKSKIVKLQKEKDQLLNEVSHYLFII